MQDVKIVYARQGAYESDVNIEYARQSACECVD